MNFDYISLELPQSFPKPFSKWGHTSQPYLFNYLTGTDLARCMCVNRTWMQQLLGISYIWKKAYCTDFCLSLQNDKTEVDYKVLYEKKIATYVNIKNNIKKRPIEVIKVVDSPSYEILINNRFLIAQRGEISIYDINTGQLERILSCFPSIASPSILAKQSSGSMDRNILEHPLDHGLVLSREQGDLFFTKSISGSTICLWEASTGNCLFSNDNFQYKTDDSEEKAIKYFPKLVDNKMIYSTDQYWSTENNEKMVVVEIWDFRKRELILTFNLPHFGHSYEHQVSGDTLISEDGQRIIGHHLETGEKLFELKNQAPKGFQMLLANSELLIYRNGTEEIDIHSISDGTLIDKLKCGHLSHSILCKVTLCVMKPYGISRLDIWDLKKRERIKELPCPPTNGFWSNVNPQCPFVIHHDHLILSYRNGFKSGILQVWNLKDFSLVISEVVEVVSSIEFIDEQVMALVSETEIQQISFWDILAGKRIDSRDLQTYLFCKTQRYEFLKGKIMIKGLITDQFGKGEPSIRWVVEDYSVLINRRPTANITYPSVMKAVKSIFCFFNCS